MPLVAIWTLPSNHKIGEARQIYLDVGENLNAEE
jgi:hypothetical protein